MKIIQTIQHQVSMTKTDLRVNKTPPASTRQIKNQISIHTQQDQLKPLDPFGKYKNRILIIPPDEKNKRKSQDFPRESNQNTKKIKRQRPDSGSKGAAGVGKPAKQTQKFQREGRGLIERERQRERQREEGLLSLSQ